MEKLKNLELTANYYLRMMAQAQSQAEKNSYKCLYESLQACYEKQKQNLKK